MKGREQSPVKKRPRAPEDSRDRGGSSRKPGAPLAVNGCNSSRRNLHHDKRDMRDSDGHGASSRSGGNFDYGMKSTADIASSRSDSRPPQNSECEYRTLKISGLGTQLSDEEAEDGLFHEFSKYGDVSVKISRENDQRVAFVNFRRAEDARAGKHARGKLVLYDRPLQIDPVYDRRRSRSPVSKDMFPTGHRHIPPQRQLSPTGVGYRDYRLQQLAMGRIPPPHHRDLDRERDFPGDSRHRAPFESAAFHEEDILSPEVDQGANRTLFLGNLDVNVTENELRRAFDRFGVITEVDIKRAVRGQANNYGFIKFENLDMAHRAKVVMAGKILGRNPIKIGYGKPTPTTRLWVGGLGPWVSLAALDKEFDRFGIIRTIEYRKGDMWAYIQYESLDAAQAACANMRGFPLGGPDRRLRVDFADTEHRYHNHHQQQQQQQFMQLPLPLQPYDIMPPSYSHRLTDSVPERSPSFPGRFRDRDIYPPAEWSGPGIHDRIRGGGYDLLEHNERPSWPGPGHELQNRAFNHKRRPLEEGWHPDRLPDADFGHRRHGRSIDRSSGGSSRDGGRYSDPDRQPSSGKNSPVAERPNKDSGIKKRRTVSPSSPGSDKRRKPRDCVKSPAKRESNLSSKSEGQILSPVWQGSLLLKNSSFPAALHMLDGSMSVAKSLLVEGSTGGQVSQLKITQRLRMDQSKLEEVSRRIKAASSGGYSVLLAMPGKETSPEGSNPNERPLKNLVLYLKQKEAAGIISLPVGGCRDKEQAGVLHAFPPCEFSQQFLDDSAKSFVKSDEDYMVMVIVSGAP